MLPPTPRAGLVLVLAGIAASACTLVAPDPGAQRDATVARVPAPPAHGAERDGTGVRVQALYTAFDRARRRVGASRHLDLTTLALDLVDDATIDQRVRLETERLVARQFRDSRYAQHFVDRVMQTQAGTYAALYVAPQHRVLVSLRALNAFLDGIDDASLRDDALLALMIHEVVHAADDREHDIDAVRTLDFRAAFTQSAVFEGHAQWATRQLCALEGCLDGLAALDRFMFGDVAPVDPLVPASASLSRNVLEYAYIEGERFVTALAARDEGEQALRQLLAEPPVDPIQILDPHSWPNVARDERNRDLLAAAAQAAHPWTRGDRDTPARAVVAASPLKGVNLRSDPERRRAAVDGFTRLLNAMVALELHDERDIAATPVAMTMLRAESSGTAALFARTLHANNVAVADRARSSTDTGTGLRLMRTEAASAEGLPQGLTRTLVAVREDVVLQLAALDEPAAMLDAYARAVFAGLPSTGRDEPVSSSSSVR